MTTARACARSSPRGRGRRAGRLGRALQRPPGREGGVGGLRARRRLELRRHGLVRVAAAAGEPHRAADGAARLRVVPLDPGRVGRAGDLHVRAADGRALGRRLPAPRHELPDGAARARDRSRARDRGLRDLPAGLRARAAVRRAEGPRLLELPSEPAPDRARRGPRRLGLVFGALAYAVLFVLVLVRSVRRWRAHAAARAAPADAGLRLRAADVPARRDREGGRRRRRVVGGVRRRPRCCRSRSSAGCCAATSPSSTPSCASGWRSCARRARGWSRPATPSAAGSSATCTTGRRRGSWRSRCCCGRRARRRPARSASCSTARRRSCRPASRSCASSRAGSTPRC